MSNLHEVAPVSSPGQVKLTHGLGEVVGAGVGVVVGGAGVVGFKHLMYKQLSVAFPMFEMNDST